MHEANKQEGENGMKYKGIELREGTDSEAELLVDALVTKHFEDDDDLEEYMEDLEEKILTLFEDYHADVYTEVVMDNLMQVRSDDITFDEAGIGLLTDIYNKVCGLGLKGVAISIAVHVDGPEWFKQKDGSAYNEDTVTLEEFLKNVEY